MKEYIEREAVLALKQTPGAYGMDISSKEVEAIPAADVEPVRHGRWVLTTYEDDGGEYQIYKCECGAITARRRNYCPDCGAKMEVE